MRQPYSYFKGSVVSLTEYTVNSLHQILHSALVSNLEGSDNGDPIYGIIY